MAEKSRKKVLYIITKSAWGGAGKYVYDLAVNLPKDRFEVFVAAGNRDELAKKIITAGIPYFEIKNFQRDINFLKEIFSYFEILLLLLKIRPDIIHVNSSKAGGIVGVASLDYRLLTFNFKVKTIFTAHGWAFHEVRPKWQLLLIKLFTKITCFYYSKIICVSEFDRLSAVKNHIVPKRKLITIHNGIKIEDYQFLPKEEARKKLFEISQFHHMVNLTNNILIGTVGEFTKNKGQKYLIDAIKLLITRYPLLVTLIGWGEEKSNLSLLVTRYSLQNNVFLIDNLTNAAFYLKAFDIFVLPSL
ncbi:MAG: glycosyltransferase, partial [Candidatus Tagabacteria bacterium]